MSGRAYSDYLWRRGDLWYYKRTVPADVKSIWRYGPKNGFVVLSLKTTDEATAHVRARKIHDEHDSLFSDLLLGINHDAADYDKAVSIARAHNLEYRSASVLGSQPIETKLAHAEAAMLAKPGIERDALLGLVPKPQTTISETLVRYFDLSQVTIDDKSEDQKRKWKNPRRRAVNNLISLVGDKTFYKVSDVSAYGTD